MAWQLFLIPVSTAFSCWLVIKLLFTIIFRRILPEKQSAIASGLGKYLATQFFSADEIQKKIGDGKNLDKIMPTIEQHIDDFLRNKLKKEMPVVGMFIGDKTIDSLKTVFINELQILFPQIIGSYAKNMVDDLNIEQLVVNKVSAISANTAERTFNKHFSREVRMLYLMAAVLGLVVGSVIMLIIILLQ